MKLHSGCDCIQDRQDLCVAAGNGYGDELHTEIFQEFLGFQFLIDMVPDEFGENGFAFPKGLL